MHNRCALRGFYLIAISRPDAPAQALAPAALRTENGSEERETRIRVQVGSALARRRH